MSTRESFAELRSVRLDLRAWLFVGCLFLGSLLGGLDQLFAGKSILAHLSGIPLLVLAAGLGLVLAQSLEPSDS